MRKTLLFIILFVVNQNLNSAPVSIDSALIYAQNFYLNQYNSAHEIDLNQVSFSEPKIRIYNQKATFYIFNESKGNGFVLVSTDNLMFPVLGYSFSGEFRDDIEVPSLEYLLQKYMHFADFLIEKGKQEPEIKEAWHLFDQGKKSQAESFVLPIITTNWDQDCYYNLYAPTDVSGPCSHAYAGCVATSMAMVMKYHNFPSTGYGSHSYTHSNYGNISANFGNTTYAWTTMPTQLSSSSTLAQKQAVGRLMADCGISVDMNYSANGSGSNIAFAASSLSDYFRYNYSATEELASAYTASEWGQLLRNQIDRNLPMVYSGMDATSYGHAWALDGYQGTTYFHMNWGWSGSNNGYFLLSNLSAGGYNFTSDQSAVINIIPSGNACSGTTTLKSKSGKIEDGSGVANYGDNLNCSYLISPVSGNIVVLTFDEFNTESGQDIVNVYDGISTTSTLLGSFSGNSLPSVLIANSGNMLITFTTNGSNNSTGWKAKWSQLMPVFCNSLKIVTDPTSTFDDGSGSNSYLNNSQCKWLIRPNGATTISLRFDEFDLHATDHLYVYNGANTNATLIGSYTGTSLPPSLKSTGNSLLLYFVSGSANTSNGWRVTYFMDALSAEDSKEKESILIYPNPACSELNIQSEYMNQINQIRIYTIQGQLVKTIEATPNQKSVININIQNLTKGYYLLQIIGDTNNYTKSFIKREF